VKNKFKIIFQDNKSRTFDVDYTLHNTIIAEKWFSKIKHLSRINIDTVESEFDDVCNLDSIYSEFCKFADIEFNTLPTKRDQKLYNKLHQIYEQTHNRLSVKKNNSIIYKFHHAIHKAESKKEPKKKINVGWGIKEGPLTEQMLCQPFYDDRILKNNLYLPWAELGKTPHKYWKDAEPKDQKRFNELCKPHLTFRAKFFVALEDSQFPTFTKEFNRYFDQFKRNWLSTNLIDDWTERDEWSAPLLAYSQCSDDLSGMRFKKIII